MIFRGAIALGLAWLVLSQTPKQGFTHVPLCIAHTCAGANSDAWRGDIILHLAEIKQDLRMAATTREERASFRMGSKGFEQNPDPVLLNESEWVRNAHFTGHTVPLSRVLHALRRIKSSPSEWVINGQSPSERRNQKAIERDLEPVP
jgi:hypothetical protein